MEEINFNQENPTYSVNLGMPDLKNLAGWATFRAIIDIIVGALACLGIITAAYGIPQIIAGVKLLNATEEMKRYMATNDTQRISESFVKLNGYFKLNGISTIIKMCMGIVFFVLYFAVIMYFISNAPELFPGLEY